MQSTSTTSEIPFDTLISSTPENNQDSSSGSTDSITERILKTPSIFYRNILQPIPRPISISNPLNINIRKLLTQPQPNTEQPSSSKTSVQFQKQKQILIDNELTVGSSSKQHIRERSTTPEHHHQPIIGGSSTSTSIMSYQQDPWRGGRMPSPQPTPNPNDGHTGNNDSGYSTILLIFIPVMVVVLTVLLGLVVFLVAVLYMRRRKSIRLTEDGGPLDLSKSDGVIGEGGLEGVESRWMETLDPDVKEAYKRAKDWQHQYRPASVPTDITLSQFLSIQEKGVSAWSFEPDYEDNLSLYVQSRTEITFLADGPGMPAREGGGNSVMANLPLPKLNEVYYWEVKMYDKPATTEIAIGLATKPYPSFRLPGWNKYSVAYFASDGFKSHNYPFTASSYGPSLNEGDVLGVGYKPRTGTVFFTRNGRKLDDAYTGLQRLNLFPTVGANGPCTIHVNLGQAGFVFIEANVKKWGLAPMVGTLAPPPAYGSERGSILLDAGYGTPHSNNNVHQSNLGGVNALLEAARSRHSNSHHFATSHNSNQNQLGTSAGSSSISSSINSTGSGNRRNRTPRRSRQTMNNSNIAAGSSVPVNPSPLREANEAGPGPSTSRSRRAFGQQQQQQPDDQTPLLTSDNDENEETNSSEEGDSDDAQPRFGDRESSPIEHNPPTPNLLDISMHSLRNNGQYFEGRYNNNNNRQNNEDEGNGSGSGESDSTARPSRLTLGRNGSTINNTSPPPPGYAPLDPHVYAAGLPGDLPEEMVNQAIAAMSGDANITPAQIQAAAQAVAAQAQASAQAIATAFGNANTSTNSRPTQSMFQWFRQRL
ncbi:uncharacterized protein L201_001687 [Kwoniella dendrophila CBS 6074]|uniref:B30.2/SPRY domain-containing protein n=1 Tax=Kwoniella dendrophila CBS 6074 TaxID=1295534 RepID=A0AAX4JPK4_9TREE